MAKFPREQPVRGAQGGRAILCPPLVSRSSGGLVANCSLLVSACWMKGRQKEKYFQMFDDRVGLLRG
jgi:hypothetical protein